MPAASLADGIPQPLDIGRVRQVPAWLLSVGFHTVLLVAFGLFAGPAQTAPSVEQDRTAGIALVQRTETETTYFSEVDSDAMSDALTASEVDSTSPPSPLAESSIAPAIQLPSSHALSNSAGLGQVLPGAIGFTTGSSGTKSVPGGQARTQVFGAQGTGTKFVYVFDRSASMSGFQGRPMVAARTQLLASLKDLDSVHQFQILFYNEKPLVFNPDHPRRPQILFASDVNKTLAKSFIEGVVPAGGTSHLDALKLAIGMKPDVIFFLTDAAEPQLTPSELATIRRRNSGQATIHSIEFGSGPFLGGDNFLMKLARQNSGKHIYVDVTKLP
jgi:hypothetical protein